MEDTGSIGIEVNHPRCPFCHAAVQPGPDDKRSCADCMAWHHAECWDSHGGCSACNQDRPAVRVDSLKDDPRPVEARRVGRIAAVVGVLLLSLVGGGVFVLLREGPPPTPPVSRTWNDGFVAAATEEEKTRWCRVGAEQNDPAAMNLLGFRLAGGIGCAQDTTEAVSWGRRAAELGHSNAMFGVARMLEGGFGTPQDLAEAAHWYRRAIQAGDPQASYALEDLLTRHPELR